MMQKEREKWRSIIESELNEYSKELDVDLGDLIPTVQNPPKAELGDLAFPLFIYSKPLKNNPNALAQILKERLEAKIDLNGASLMVAGPYLNVKLDLSSLTEELVKVVNAKKEFYGNTTLYSGKNIMVEFSCPNTNKPLHLGHLRNDAIGQSIAAILKANGASVYKVNLINNRGIHICKSMLAYQKYGNGETPESSLTKGDHLVGKYYVKYAQMEKEEPQIAEEAQSLLREWEKGDQEVHSLWLKMNKWTMDGLKETYAKTGVSFDRYYYESETYALGKDKVLKGLKDGVFYQEEDGSIWVDLEEINLDKKVLLRKDGTSLYLTQDIGTAIERHKDWPFDSLIYVVASEQTYHFKVLFYVLEKLGYKWAKELYHLAYGMVNLPDGKMKSREGTVVDADELIDQLTTLALEEIKNKEREEEVGDAVKTAEKVALGALNYYLLQTNPLKDMIFNPAESISFNGNTGPYLQYMGARISSMVRKFEVVSDEYENIAFDAKELTLEQERELIKMIANFPTIVENAAKELNPSDIASYLYDLSRLFSRYYHEVPIIKAETKEKVVSRFTLVKMALQVFRNAYELVGIPFLESM